MKCIQAIYIKKPNSHFTYKMRPVHQGDALGHCYVNVLGLLDISAAPAASLVRTVLLR